ncbi:MAG: MauE/DoxX family redox-associated membrane protein [Ignavibacteria bacterium]|nr:MauE/DoxX family redox-associated membrane protein [Ignavibacteria bacterium]
MKKFLANKYLLLLSRLILSFIFIYAGMEKITDPEGFARAINNYKLLPFSLINIFALILPWIEVISGILLLFGITVRENSFITSSLLGIFIIAIAVSLLRGLNIDCGCFGTAGVAKVGIQKLLENFLLVLLGIQLVYFGGGTISLSKESLG